MAADGRQMTAGARGHHFWDCVVAEALHDVLREHANVDIARHQLWLAHAPPGLSQAVWDTVFLAAVAALEYGRQRLYACRGAWLAAANLSRPGVPQLLAALAAVRRGYRSLICPASITAPEREVARHSPYGGGEPDWSGSNPDPVANCVLLTLGGGASRPGHMLAAGFNPHGTWFGYVPVETDPGYVRAMR
ncbi:hypothetical protein CHLRE_17g698900v5 [Chlamydomonas reinhardtii]|uniref:Uncharacterized protein n=1 Tax=Chlamydomonas reinhardtii TaxID=3055 RepID=A0A2K3CNT0_CHLRE|nr:uncharacterized protein CHLRE_17g698900v5 [Chlamydomonas reinhardtii]PNW69937.1 hypothetical protein CHLRE_17g698900v5 [Chlamydomonas reinhardtii]